MVRTRNPGSSSPLVLGTTTQAAANGVASSRRATNGAGSGRIAWTLPATSCPSTCTVRAAPDETLAAIDGQERLERGDIGQLGDGRPLDDILPGAHRQGHHSPRERRTQRAAIERNLGQLDPRLGGLELRPDDLGRRELLALSSASFSLTSAAAILTLADASLRSSCAISCNSRTAAPNRNSMLPDETVGRRDQRDPPDRLQELGDLDSARASSARAGPTRSARTSASSGRSPFPPKRSARQNHAKGL